MSLALLLQNKGLHAHGTALLYDEPLVDAVVVEVVIAWQNLDEIRFFDGIEANSAVIHLHLGCARCPHTDVARGAT